MQAYWDKTIDRKAIPIPVDKYKNKVTIVKLCYIKKVIIISIIFLP